MDWESGPPVLVGEKVFWMGNAPKKPVCGLVKWIGNIPEISSDWCVGIELDVPLPGAECNGIWKTRKLFECRSEHGLIAPIEEVQKICSKNKISSINGENNLRLQLDDSQLRDLKHSDPQGKFAKETKRKNRNSYTESFTKRTADSEKERKFDEKSAIRTSDDFLIQQNILRRNSQNVKSSLQKEKTGRKDSRKFDRNSKTLNPLTELNVNENLGDCQTLDIKTYINEVIKNMNDVAGYFKEVKEGDERFENQNKMDDLMLYGTPDGNEQGQSKPKKLFSFLKWFNKKHKHEPNLKLFKESSATSSPMFPRKETSSCESIDTLFSTQTVRSFAYIPPTQYVPSAPPLELEKSVYDNVCENNSLRNDKSDETESIYERRKKRKAPEPPRLSRENSLPTTLEHKKNDEEDFDGAKTYHRRTVSESFKDKKAGAYCHVQGKRKAPPPPSSSIYPNLQKIDSQYPSLYKKKKPAPPPPEVHPKTQNPSEPNQSKKDVQIDRDISQPNKEVQKEKSKDSKDNGHLGKDEMGTKTTQTTKASLAKDSSLSPLPSRPWYKRSHRDSTGSNIIRKDLLKGFDKKKNKESDDWMPEVGFSRRSLSTESSHSKFNIFSKLEKTEDKKKEEKRKSQISILTNISELDREAAEIVRKEQAEEKKMIAANDAKYYSPKGNEKTPDRDRFTNKTEQHNGYNKDPFGKGKPMRDEQAEKLNAQSRDKILKDRTVFDNGSDAKGLRNRDFKEDEAKINEKKENQLNAEDQTKEHPKQILSASTDMTKPIQLPTEKAIKPSQNSSQSRLNHFNVENKNLNYLNEPWVCKKCTLENPGWRVFCEICNSVKPRFLFNNTPQNTNSPIDTKVKQSSPKTENVSEKKDENVKEKIPEKENKNQITNITPQRAEEENRETKLAETLDELRKKRMNFFSSKLETLPESDKTETGSLSKDGNEATKVRVTDNSPKQKEATTAESTTATPDASVPEEKIKVRDSPETSAIQKEKPNTNAVQINANKDANKETVNSSQSSEDKVIEAYVVTKTIILEDIIVKKPERGRKVSASVQTKSKLSPSPETAKVIMPPPRTKKLALDPIAEKKKEPETQLQSGNGFQKNYRQEELEELTNRLTRAEGLADFRANIETMPPDTEMNTVAVNRLLRKLETAINCGDHFVAGGLAKELALMKINCSVTRQTTPSTSTSNITLDLYVEDKVSHRGPIPIQVSPTMSVLELKNKVQQELGIPLEVQRWILGKKLAADDSKTLEAEGVKSNYCPVFLYLVAPGNRKTNAEVVTQIGKPDENTPGSSKPKMETSSGAKSMGLYYNYEEDHYSYCEDSDDEKKSSSPDVNAKTEESNSTSQNQLSNDTANTDRGVETKKTENHSSIVDLKSRDSENDIDKELKLISVNSVKQKVEQLNKTFAENSKATKPPLRSSRSPETWKCGSCHVVNLPGKLNCASCNVKKVFSGPYSRNLDNDKESPIKELLKKENSKLIINENNNENIHYKALVELQDADLVPNSEPFNCSICLVDYAPAEGVTLKDCLHTFCRPCLVSTVQFSEDAEVKCPYLDETYSCPSVLQQREIKALVPQGIFELHLAKSVKEAENKIDNAFHCKTPDCKGWCIYEDNVNEFRCPVCKYTNCLTCQAVHTGINCREFQERMKVASETDVDAKKSTDMLNEMVEKGEAMVCPKCQVVLMKKWGCDWLKCSMCKTEICWVTRGFRWGPEGKGDTSGGCKCGVNGVKCHPKCNYCH